MFARITSRDSAEHAGTWPIVPGTQEIVPGTQPVIPRSWPWIYKMRWHGATRLKSQALGHFFQTKQYNRLGPSLKISWNDIDTIKILWDETAKIVGYTKIPHDTKVATNQWITHYYRLGGTRWNSQALGQLFHKNRSLSKFTWHPLDVY
jgi:hypothetical protein